jgi:hypothetical protein
MSKKLFTEEQVIALRANPCVERASHLSVSFTEQFKRDAYRELLSGKPMWQVFSDRGIDTDALGPVRVMKFRQHVNDCAKRGDGFKNMREARRGEESGGEDTATIKLVKSLENEVAYLRQTVEFLKKTQQADSEARKPWESKRRPK